MRCSIVSLSRCSTISRAASRGLAGSCAISSLGRSYQKSFFNMGCIRLSSGLTRVPYQCYYKFYQLVFIIGQDSPVCKPSFACRRQFLPKPGPGLKGKVLEMKKQYYKVRSEERRVGKACWWWRALSEADDRHELGI